MRGTSVADPVRREPQKRSRQGFDAAGGVPLIATKLTPPHQTRWVRRRPRLLEWAADPTRWKLSHVSAPAGYGKTVLLTQWWEAVGEAGLRRCWLSLDEADDDLGSLLAYIVAALGTVEPGFGAALAALLRPGAGVPASAAMATLINEIASLGYQIFLFVDDLHFVVDPQARRALRDLIEKTPANFHLVAASRDAPGAGVAKIRASGRLFEVAWPDLSFSPAEIRDYFSQGHGPRLTESDMAALGERTEGWIAALQLASISLGRGEAVDEFLKAFSGEHRDIADFLADQVLSRLDSVTRDFLLKTALLSRLSPALCDALTGRRDGRAMLDTLESANFFLFSLDSVRNWYRYHHLFAEFLVRRLKETRAAEVAELLRRAGAWCARNGHIEEAVDYLIAAKDYVAAAAVLDRHALRLWRAGLVSRLMTWIARLPCDVVRGFPRLRLDQVWGLILNWRFAEAEAQLVDLRKQMAETAAPADTGAGPDDEERKAGRRDLLFGEIMLAMFRDDIAASEKMAREWLAAYPQQDVYLRASIEAVVLYCRREQFDARYAAANVGRIRHLYAEADSIYGPVWFDTINGHGALLTGDLATGEGILNPSIEAATAVNGRLSPLTAMPAATLAGIYYEQGRLPAARALLDDYLPLLGAFGFIDSHIVAHITAAHLHAGAKNWSVAHSVLDDADRWAQAHGFARLFDAVAAERIRQALLCGEVDAARRVARAAGIEGPVDSFVPGPAPTTRDFERALARARIAVATGQNAPALAALRRWLKFLEARGCMRLAVQTALAMVHACDRMGETQAAQRQLVQAVRWSYAGGMRQTLVDSGEPVRSLLGQIRARMVETEDALAPYVRSLLASMGTGDEAIASAISRAEPGEEQTGEPLKPREIEILQLVGRGLENRDIALGLGLTENTVKWHLRNTFAKLGVRQRFHAVNRARRLGYLP